MFGEALNSPRPAESDLRLDKDLLKASNMVLGLKWDVRRGDGGVESLGRLPEGMQSVSWHL